DGRRDDPGSRVEPQGSKNPAPPDAPDQTQGDVPAQSVASALHNPPGQQAGQHSRENPHQERHDFSSFIWLRRTRVTSPAPSRALHLVVIPVYPPRETSAASAPGRLSADRRFVAPEGSRAFRSRAGRGPGRRSSPARSNPRAPAHRLPT